MTLTPEEEFNKAFYEELKKNCRTKAIAEDFKNLQTPADDKLATVIDTENNFELKSSGHYIIQTAQAIGVEDTAKMVSACSTDAYNAPELAKQWVRYIFNQQFSDHCREEENRLKISSDKRDPKALKRKIAAYNNLVSPTERDLSLSLLKNQALVAARMHTSRLHLGRPKSYNKMKDFFSDQETAVDLIEKLDVDAKQHKSRPHLERPKSYNEMKDSSDQETVVDLIEKLDVDAKQHKSRPHLERPKSYNEMKDSSDQETVVDLIEKLKSKDLTQDTETKSTDQRRPAAISNASTEPYDSKSDRDSPTPDSKSDRNSSTPKY